MDFHGSSSQSADINPLLLGRPRHTVKISFNEFPFPLRYKELSHWMVSGSAMVPPPSMLAGEGRSDDVCEDDEDEHGDESDAMVSSRLGKEDANTNLLTARGWVIMTCVVVVGREIMR